jgi:hypothetical protein
MVTNPKYIGANVSNRWSGKLRRQRIRNPPEMWIRRDNAFQAIVDPELFRQAEVVAASRLGFYSDEQLLEHLRQFLLKNGRLSERLISASVDMPSSEVYHVRFGGLLEAYRRIGYHPDRNFSYVERERSLLPIRRGFTVTIIDELTRSGASVRQDARTKLLIVNGNLRVRVCVSRCRSLKQSHRWLLRLRSPLQPNITVIARLAPGNESILDYFYFRSCDIDPRLTQVTVAAKGKNRFGLRHVTDLTFLGIEAGLEAPQGT